MRQDEFPEAAFFRAVEPAARPIDETRNWPRLWAIGRLQVLTIIVAGSALWPACRETPVVRRDPTEYWIRRNDLFLSEPTEDEYWLSAYAYQLIDRFRELALSLKPKA